jgi:hypothetical protein
VELAMPANLFQVRLDSRYTPAYLPPVYLKLGLTGPSQTHTSTAPPCSATASLPCQVCPRPGQPGKTILILGQFHLKLTLSRTGMLGENVEDEPGPIQDLDVIPNRFLQVSQLARRELIIKDDQITAKVTAQLHELIHFPRAHEGGRVKACQALPRLTCDHQASSA